MAMLLSSKIEWRFPSTSIRLLMDAKRKIRPSGYMSVTVTDRGVATHAGGSRVARTEIATKCIRAIKAKADDSEKLRRKELSSRKVTQTSWARTEFRCWARTGRNYG
jgi:hypothetical protein